MQLRRARQPFRRVRRELLEPRKGLVGRRRMLHPFVQLADLHVHRPHHLVHSVGLNEGVLDRELLALDHFGLERDALGEGVERHQTLFRVLTQLLELREWSELLFHLLDCRHGGGGVFARHP